jgi:copper(I)-binding protein
MNARHAAALLTVAILFRLTPASACDLQVLEGWIREAPPAATTLAAYGILKNIGSKPLTVKAITTAVADMTMLHETIIKDGMAQMRMIDDPNIPPAAQVKLAPGGKHLMLTGLKVHPKVGDHVKIAFTDSAGCVTQGDFVVRSMTLN